jgi:NADH:ubiquinone reductase (H+-translocating)
MPSSRIIAITGVSSPAGVRSKILLVFERAEAVASTLHAREEVSSEEIRRPLTFALVGAGTVGVEMAGTLAEMSRMALAHDFRHIDPTTARILLYEATPRILPTYPEILSLSNGTWRAQVSRSSPTLL